MRRRWRNFCVRGLRTSDLEMIAVEVVDQEKLIVSVPAGVSDLGSRLFMKPGHLSFHMAHPDYHLYTDPAEDPLVPGAVIFPYQYEPERGLLVDSAVAIDGDELASARATESYSGGSEIVLRFTKSGAGKFEALSRAHNQMANGAGVLPFAIVLDGEVLSSPVFIEPISSGTAIISGDFTEAGSTVSSDRDHDPDSGGV